MLTIRLEKPADIPAIRQLNFDAFGGPVEAEIVDRLRTDKALRYSLVGSVFDHGNDSEQIVAYLALSPVTITDSNKTYAGLGLGPVAVSPTMQNNGFGSQIIHYFFDQLAREDDQLVVLLGHASYYPRFGFTPSYQYGIRWEMDAVKENFMVKELRPGALAEISGVVKYHPVFTAT